MVARFSAPVQTGPGAHPASCTMGTGSLPVVKRPGRGADHPPDLNAEIMKGQGYTSTHHLVLRGLLWGEPLCLFSHSSCIAFLSVFIYSSLFMFASYTLPKQRAEHFILFVKTFCSSRSNPVLFLALQIQRSRPCDLAVMELHSRHFITFLCCDLI